MLSRAIAAAPDDLPAALLRYQTIRRERASWLQEYSRAADRHFQLADPVAQRRRDEHLKERQGDFQNGFPPGQLRIYGYNPVAEMEAAPRV
ncbi:MAG: hypothetical protein QF893_13975, partial [Alphaproteobacteria bacterium]|nr:hypothetical protein [Alphaproteobacteria bacterium]